MAQEKKGSQTPIYVHCSKGVCFLTINQPKTRNALSPDVVLEMQRVIDEAAQDYELRALVLRGAQGFFSAGGNIGNFKARLAHANEEVARKNRSFGYFLERLIHFPAPVISVVEGAAIGGGMGLACASDIVLSTASARFALTETTLGIIPAQIFPFVSQRLGVGVARRLGMNGQRLNGVEALQLGLVDHVVRETHINSDIASYLTMLLRCAPHANKELKQLSLQMKNCDLSTFLDMAAQRFAVCMQVEGKDGISAFREKKSPKWAVTLCAQEVQAALPKEESL